MRSLICFSVSREEAERLAEGGPRRDIPELANLLDGTLLYRSSGSGKGPRWARRLAGPHIRHAWNAARAARKYDVVFADGEHVGLPLLLFLALGMNRKQRVVILGHFMDRRWKKLLIRLGTRLVPGGTFVLHSAVQARITESCAGGGWDVVSLPYQVDQEFWRARTAPVRDRVSVVSAGREHRDYDTLTAAVRGLDVDVQLAAGSHWARAEAGAAELPPNVTYLDRTLSFTDLRDLYDQADIVVVPVHPVSNQSGVTTILEGMSMGRPVIASATPGQREVLTGPLATATACQGEPTSDRGPQVIGLPSDPGATGIYVKPGDAAGFRAAIQKLATDPALRERLGTAGRASVERNFQVEQFAERFAEVIRAAGSRR